MASQETISLLLEVKSKLDDLNKTVVGFKQVGDAGVESAKRLTNAQQEELGLIEKLQKELNDLEEARDRANDVDAIKEYNKKIEQTENELKKLTETTTGAVGQFKDVAAVAADFAIVSETVGQVVTVIKDLAVAAFEAVKGIAEDDVALKNLSQTSGSAKETIVAVQNELVKLGESADTVKGAFAQFSGFLADALADPASEAGEAAGKLGINLDSLAKSSNQFDDALKQVGKSLNPLTLSLEQSKAAALALGDDDFSGLIPALADLDKKIENVQKRGQILTPEQSEEAGKVFQKIGDITASIDGLTKQLLAELLPATTAILDHVKQGIEGLDKDSIEGLKAGIREIGRALESLTPLIVNVSKFLLEFAGDFGTAISAILNPIETLNFLITGNITLVEQQAKGFDTASKAAKDQSGAIETLKKKTQELISVQQASIAVQSALNDLRIQATEFAIQRGLIGETEALKTILEKRVENAKEQLGVAETLRKERENIALEEQKRLGQISSQTRIELLQAQQAEIVAATALAKAQFDLQVKPVEAATKKQIELIQEKTTAFKLEIQKQTIAVDEAEKAQSISHERAARERLAISRSIFQQEIDNIDKLLKNENIKGEQRKELENQRKALVLEIDALQIEGSAKVRQAIISDIQAEIAAINQRKAASEQELKVIQERRAAQLESLQLAIKQYNAVSELANRESSAAAIIADSTVKVFGSAEAINAKTASIEGLSTAIEELRAFATNIEATFAFPGKDVVVAEARRAAEVLNEEFINRTQRAQIQAEAEAAQRRLEEAKRVNAELTGIEQERLDQIREAQKQLAGERRSLNQDRISEEESFNKKLEDLANDLANDLKDIAERKAAEEKEIGDRLVEEERQRQEKIKQIKTKATKEAADEAAQIELGLLSKIGSLEEKIKAIKDPKNKDRIKLEQELATEKEKIDRANRKRDAIAALEKENLTEEEFSKKKEAIEKDFRLEETASEQRIEINKITDETIRKEKLARLEQLLQEQKAGNQKALEEEIASLKAAAARKAKQEEEERQRRLAGYDQQAKDRQGAFDKAKADEEKDHKDRVAALDARQKEIRAKYKETYDEINKRAIDSATQIGATGQAIADAFALGNKELEKYIANLEKAGKAQAGLNPNGSTTGSASTTPTTSNSSIGNNSSPTAPSSPNPFSSPGNNSAGAGTFNITTTNAQSGQSSQSSSSSQSQSASTPNSTASNTPKTNSGASGLTQQESAQANKKSGGGGSYPSVPNEIKTGADYKALVMQTLEALLSKAGVADVNAPGSGDIFLKGKKGNQLEAEARAVGASLLRAYGLTVLNNNPDLAQKANEIYQKQINGAFAGGAENAVISITVVIDFKDGKPLVTLKGVRKQHADFADQMIAIVEKFNTRGKDKGAGASGDIGTKDTPIIKPDTGGKGNTKGDVGGQVPGGKEPPSPAAEQKNEVALARERENFSEIEEKNAETGAGLGGPNFPGSPSTPPSSDSPGTSSTDPSGTTPSSNPTSQPNNNFDNNRSVVGASQPITATAVIEKFFNIENQTIVLSPTSTGNEGKVTKEIANGIIDAIIPLIPDRPDLVSVLTAELDAKNTTDFASRNPLRAFKV